ncbi:tyrosine-protein phosphatase Lar isoform X1, partial [Vespula maculifrons]
MIAAENLPAGFPMITQAPAAKVVEMGHNAVLLCGAIGSPTPIISWVRNMLPMDTSNPRFTVLDSASFTRNLHSPTPFPIEMPFDEVVGYKERRKDLPKSVYKRQLVGDDDNSSSNTSNSSS